MIKRTGRLLVASLFLLANGCSDDAGGDGPGIELDGAIAGEGGGQPVSILPFSPDSVTLAENLLHDVHVKLDRPAPQEIYVDVESTDSATVNVVTSVLRYPRWSQTQMTTIQGVKENSQTVDVVFTIRGSAATQRLKVKVLRFLPDGGLPSDS